MNKINIIFNFVLLIAVTILFYLYFCCNTTFYLKSNNNTISPSKTMYHDTSTLIAFVNIDTLISQYIYYHKLKNQLISKQQNMQNNLQSRSEKLEKEIYEFQKKVDRGGFLTEATKRSAQEELIKKQQELIELKDELSEKLIQQEQKMNKMLHDTIIKYIHEFNKDNCYSYILSYTVGGVILYGDKANDITDTIVNLLNYKYHKIQ